MQSQPSIEQWIERLEGFSQGEGDGDHWMRVYGELIETLEAIVQDSRGESLRALWLLSSIKRRYAHWERVAQREGRHQLTGRFGSTTSS